MRITQWQIWGFSQQWSLIFLIVTVPRSSFFSFKECVLVLCFPGIICSHLKFKETAFGLILYNAGELNSSMWRTILPTANRITVKVLRRLPAKWVLPGGENCLVAPCLRWLKLKKNSTNKFPVISLSSSRINEQYWAFLLSLLITFYIRDTKRRSPELAQTQLCLYPTKVKNILP